jgi:hypothetical protein
LMVLEHQTRMTNLITRVGWEVRMALSDQLALNQALKEPEDNIGDSARRRIDNAAEALLKYMLFSDEALLEAPVRGTSSFAGEFEGRGPRDRLGRSLRELDLKRRMLTWQIAARGTRKSCRTPRTPVMQETSPASASSRTRRTLKPSHSAAICLAT